jgi:hypothetical protein
MEDSVRIAVHLGRRCRQATEVWGNRWGGRSGPRASLAHDLAQVLSFSERETQPDEGRRGYTRCADDDR